MDVLVANNGEQARELFWNILDEVAPKKLKSSKFNYNNNNNNNKNSNNNNNNNNNITNNNNKSELM